MAAVIGVLGGVGEQVHQHLLQSGSVREHEDCTLRHLDGQGMSMLLYQRLHGFQRPLSDAAEYHALLAQLNPAGVDARDLKQIIDEMCQLPQLTLDDDTGFQLERTFVTLQPQQLHCI